MPRYNDENIIEACQALARVPSLRQQIQKAYPADAPRILQILKLGEQLPDEFSGAYDLAVEVLVNEAPEVQVFEAEQDKGVYQVTIRGFPGAYFVKAPEYDASEVFVTKNQARSYIYENFGEFLH
jgi:hypothetical protein